MSFNRSHNRHMRHNRFTRLRHGRIEIAFLDAQVSRLTADSGKTLSAASLVAATGVLTGSANFSDGDTIVIGAKTYTIQATLTNVDGHVHLGGTLSATLTNLANAINASGGVPGTDYAAAETADANVTAVGASTTVTVTAKTPGASGNAVATTATIASAHGSWGAATLTGGTDASGSNHFTVSSHGYHEAEGPFQLTTTGTLPTGLALLTKYWVHVVDANTIALTPSLTGAREGHGYITPSGNGSGTHTIKRYLDRQGVFELLKEGNSADRIRGASSINSLN